MKGWKTWLGSIGSILTGLGVIVHCITSGDYSQLNLGIIAISGGIAAIGIGHKVEKNA
jgi:hypothetical protein